MGPRRRGTFQLHLAGSVCRVHVRRQGCTHRNFRWTIDKGDEMHQDPTTTKYGDVRGARGAAPQAARLGRHRSAHPAGHGLRTTTERRSTWPGGTRTPRRSTPPASTATGPGVGQPGGQRVLRCSPRHARTPHRHRRRRRGARPRLGRGSSGHPGERHDPVDGGRRLTANADLVELLAARRPGDDLDVAWVTATGCTAPDPATGGPPT